MTHRILKDIRYYGIDSKEKPTKANGTAEPIYLETDETSVIGQRIARKLNELQFSFGEADHLYIVPLVTLPDGEIVIQPRDKYEPRIQYVNFGCQPETVRELSDKEKDALIQTMTFTILKQLSPDNQSIVDQVEQLVAKYGSELKIHYKTKETSAYRVDVSYQIGARSGDTQAIIAHTDKKTGVHSQTSLPLNFYADIYPLVDTISVKGDILTLRPKKSFRAELYTDYYTTPIELVISTFNRLNS